MPLVEVLRDNRRSVAYDPRTETSTEAMTMPYGTMGEEGEDREKGREGKRKRTKERESRNEER